ncbi:MAG: hypothetical protein D3924_11045 [Candidatus Electrothrix sp. AR4]|nr:hypothetical protein [Candidatus Electrothrix sp. AR4]
MTISPLFVRQFIGFIFLSCFADLNCCKFTIPAASIPDEKIYRFVNPLTLSRFICSRYWNTMQTGYIMERAAKKDKKTRSPLQVAGLLNIHK